MEQKGAGGTQLVRLSTTILGLEPGMMYQFRVAAANRVGRGEYSDPSASAYTAPREPEKPTPPKVSNISLTSMQVHFIPPHDNGGHLKGKSLQRGEPH